MQDMIDVDESGFKIESTNPSCGKRCRGCDATLRVSTTMKKKVKCMMAISANGNYNMARHDIWPQEEGGLMSTGGILFSGG